MKLIDSKTIIVDKLTYHYDDNFSYEKHRSELEKTGYKMTERKLLPNGFNVDYYKTTTLEV